MAQLTRGQSFGAVETVTNTKLHNLVDLGTVTNIVDADIAANAAIQFSKLLASSISGALLTNLPLIPSGAGVIPFANIPVPFGSSYVSLVTIPNQSIQPLTLASWVDGVALRNLCSTPVDKQIRYNLLVSSIASGGLPIFNGANSFVGSAFPASPTVKNALSFQLTAATGTIYFVPCGDSSGTVGNVRWYPPCAGTVKNLYVYLTIASGNEAGLPVTIYKNSSVTTITATVANAGTTANDTTHSVSLSVGDYISVQAVVSVNDNGRIIVIALEFDPS